MFPEIWLEVIFLSHDMATILVKWTKTIQPRDKIARIQIPVLPGSKICPVTALKHMLAMVTGSQDNPRFSICRQGHWLPLTDSIVRKHLKRITQIFGWEHMHIIFHTFKRSGASWALQHGVPIGCIKQQGIWNSNCLLRYIHTHSKTVCILSYRLSDYTCPSDGCLGECFSVLLSYLLLIIELSKEIQGKFPLGYFLGFSFVNSQNSFG